MTVSPAQYAHHKHADLSIDQQLALRTAATRLQGQFAEYFGVETIERFLHSSYDQFAGRATVPNFLPLLAERFARQRLTALARVEGKITDTKPTVLFLCTHNAGRSQMALGFFTHLAGDQADRLVRRIGAGQRNQPRRSRKPWPKWASTSPTNSPNPGPTKSSKPPMSSSPWAAGTPAPSSPENATKNGPSPTPPAKTSMRCGPSATTLKNGSGACSPNSTSLPPPDNPTSTTQSARGVF